MEKGMAAPFLAVWEDAVPGPRGEGSGPGTVFPPACCSSRAGSGGQECPAALFLAPLGLRYEWGGELFVEGEEVFHALAVGEEGLLAVATVHGTVERLVGLGEARRHRHGIVEVR